MKRGRPPKPKDERRSNPLVVLLKDTEREVIQSAAQAADLPESSWARLQLLKAAGVKPKDGGG